MIEVECLFMVFPAFTALLYREFYEMSVYLGIGGAVYLICHVVSKFIKVADPKIFYAKEGFVTVAFSWILLGAVGALPFFVTREIPNYIDALFETVSGFTTTGSTILLDVEAMSHASLLWRSFTHWVGGMGVLVFILAIQPLSGNYDMHIMRAESPGYSAQKLSPRMRDSASALYLIYLIMTFLLIILLCLEGMPVFDSVCHAFGTAGTGGFGIKADSIESYSVICKITITVFMMLFGVNFNFYYLMVTGKIKDAFRIEEVRWYLIIYLAATAFVTIDILKNGIYFDVGKALLDSSFQTASIMTTTGFSTADFCLWPGFSQAILVVLMFIGACTGSTGGGIKVSRILAGFKLIRNETELSLHPQRIKPLYLEGRKMNERTTNTLKVYMTAFIFIFTLSVLIVSMDDFDLVTSFTAVAATINNIGPGLSLVGPAGNFSGFSYLSKLVLIFDMLAGRLEIFPMLVIFTRKVWRRGA